MLLERGIKLQYRLKQEREFRPGGGLMHLLPKISVFACQLNGFASILGFFGSRIQFENGADFIDKKVRNQSAIIGTGGFWSGK